MYASCAVDGTADISIQPKGWQEIAANDLNVPFWELVRAQFGFSETEPSLSNLLLRILVTDFCRGLDGDAPRKLAHFVLLDRALAANASLMVARLRSGFAHFANCNAVARAVAIDIDLVSLFSGFTAEQLVACMTFENVELGVVQDLKQRIVDGAGANMGMVRTLMARRRDGHWVNALFASTNERTRALAAGFSFADAGTAFNQYRTELFRFDQLYRHFHTAADAVEPMGWAVLHSLRDTIEG